MNSSQHLLSENSGNDQVVPDELALSALIKGIEQLEIERRTPVLLYMAEDRAPHPKIFDDEDVLACYKALQCLSSYGHLDRLDLIINTSGGSVTAVRKLLHLLHTCVDHLTILVPYKARSAGTLLCLGAHDIVMTPIAELSPIDPYLEGMQGNKLSLFSSEDIAAFCTMAQTWFGVNQDENAMKLLQLFCEKMFPPSLTHFFRAEQLVRQIALEALQFHLSDTRAETLQQITDKLLTGYHDHLYPLNENDLRDIGLPVTSPNAEETRLLWSIWEHGRAYLDRGQQSSHLSRVNGFILGSHFHACHTIQRGPALPLEQQRDETTKQFFSYAHWEVLKCEYGADLMSNC